MARGGERLRRRSTARQGRERKGGKNVPYCCPRTKQDLNDWIKEGVGWGLYGRAGGSVRRVFRLVRLKKDTINRKTWSFVKEGRSQGGSAQETHSRAPRNEQATKEEGKKRFGGR